jgi:hypothetical protein
MGTYQNAGDSFVSLPMDLNLVPKSNAVNSTSRKVQCLPLSGAIFNPNDVCKINIPVGGRGQYLDGSQTYLLFKVQNVDPAFYPLYVDGNAGSFIQKVEIFSSSGLLETVNGYNVLFQTLLDNQLDLSARQSFMSITHGTDVDPADAYNAGRGGQAILYNQTIAFAIPIFSGIVGTGISKLLPLEYLSDLRVEISWEQNAMAVLSGTSSAVSTNIWKVTFVELAVQIITVQDEASDMLRQAHKDGIQISSCMYRNYNTVLASGGVQDSTIVPLNFSSIKSALVTYRTNANLNTFNVSSISSRRNPFASSGATIPNIQMVLGNLYVPSVALRSVPEIASELFKSYGTLGSVNHRTIINRLTYDQFTETTAPTFLGTANAITTAAANLLTANAAHGMVVGDIILYTGATGNGLTTNTNYYVLTVPSTTTFTIGTSFNAPTLVITNFATQNYAFTPFLSSNINAYIKAIPSFSIGLNFDTFYQTSSTTHSGLNTQGNQTFLNTTYSAANPAQVRLDAWVHYDAVIIIDPSTKIMTIRT